METQTPETTGQSERKAKPGWEFEQQWQTAWERAAAIIDDIEFAADEELKQVKDDDPLGSAALYLRLAEHYGQDSDQAKAAHQYVVDDARTALFEALVERGHISATYSQWNSAQRAFMVGPTNIRSLAKRGAANPQLNVMEFNRRTIELHEELFIEELVVSGQLNPSRAVVRISPYPQSMDRLLAEDLGYQPDSKKYMIRWIEMDEYGRRQTKQLSMRGSQDARLSRVLSQLGVEEAVTGFNSDGILMSPVIVDKHEFTNGPADIAKLIDEDGEFLGGQPRDESYEDIERNSRKRELLLGQYYIDFAESMNRLAAQILDGNIAVRPAKELYKRRLFMTVHAIASTDPEAVREVIGPAAAENYIKAQQAERAGNAHLASQLRRAGEQTSQPIYVCGMSINPARTEQAELLALICPEFKAGQRVTCPACKKVQIIQPVNLTPDKLYCERQTCKLARVKRRQPVKTARKPLFKKTQKHRGANGKKPKSANWLFSR